MSVLAAETASETGEYFVADRARSVGYVVHCLLRTDEPHHVAFPGWFRAVGRVDDDAVHGHASCERQCLSLEERRRGRDARPAVSVAEGNGSEPRASPYSVRMAVTDEAARGQVAQLEHASGQRRDLPHGIG